MDGQKSLRIPWSGIISKIMGLLHRSVAGSSNLRSPGNKEKRRKTEGQFLVVGMSVELGRVCFAAPITLLFYQYHPLAVYSASERYKRAMSHGVRCVEKGHSVPGSFTKREHVWADICKPIHLLRTDTEINSGNGQLMCLPEQQPLAQRRAVVACTSLIHT